MRLLNYSETGDTGLLITFADCSSLARNLSAGTEYHVLILHGCTGREGRAVCAARCWMPTPVPSNLLTSAPRPNDYITNVSFQVISNLAPWLPNPNDATP